MGGIDSVLLSTVKGNESMRRLALLAVGGALWLFAAAIPALADGGPHIAALNNGSGGLTSDTCAGCHRAHTAQGAFLLKEEGTALCTSCHGSAGTGATTNVADGVQYQLAAAGGPTLRGSVLGALRNGGFENARIGSDAAVAVSYLSGTSVRREAIVPVAAAGVAVTSKHMSLTDETASTVWGNGPISATPNAGTAFTLECTSCHNPHGNGNFRILNPMPSDGATGPLVEAAVGVAVTDAALPPAGDARNYTVIQTKTGATGGTSTAPNIGTYVNTSLLASQVVSYGATAGDYLHRKVPWNGGYNGGGTAVPTANDAPNGDPVNFNAQINAWCATCHTRYTTSAVLGWGGTPPVQTVPNGTAVVYPSGFGPYNTDSGDAIFTYRHPTTSNKPCTSCHVTHGSNAQMTGYNSTHEAYPGAGTDPTVAVDADSRLLKVDNRGTCQLCHDPTNTATAGGMVFPTGATVPGAP
jgi:predicted CXXCH cytochrome family protein